MKDESTVQQEIQIQAKYSDCTLMRNNSGACIDETGRVVRFGLGNISKKHNNEIASSDLIGITKVKVTKEMIGRTLGIFTAIEVKKEGWDENKKFNQRENAQNNFINWVRHNGGFAGFASCIEKIKEILSV